MQQFILQTGCEYSARSGKTSNSESREVGVLRLQDSLLTYTSSFENEYTCLRGGKGRFNPLTCKKKNRLTVGSRRLGFNACIHVRLLNISNGDQCSSSYNVIVIGLGSRAYVFYCYRLRCTRVTCFNLSNPC